MSTDDYPANATLTPLHAVFTVLPDGSANRSVGVVFELAGAGRMSGQRIDVEVALESGEESRPWSEVCAAVVARAVAEEGIPLTPVPPAEDEASTDQEPAPPPVA
jgi:hypothetical protein